MNDTHPDIERKWIEMLRAAGPDRRLEMACEQTDQCVSLAKAAITRSYPDLSPLERDLLFIDIHYGHDLAQRVRSYLKRRG